MVLMTIMTPIAACVAFCSEVDVSSTEFPDGILNMDEEQTFRFIVFMVMMAISTPLAACVVIGSSTDFPTPKVHNGGSERTCTVKEDDDGGSETTWTMKEDDDGGSERTWTVKEDEATLENRLQDLKVKSDRIFALEHRLNLLQAEYELQSEFGRTLSLGANHLRILALENKLNEILDPETRDYRSFV